MNQWSKRTLGTEIWSSYISIWRIEFQSTEEEPRHLEQTGQEESPSPTEQIIEEEPYQETKTELDPLASSTFFRGELWTEPGPLNSPIKNLISQLLQFQQTNQNPTTNMAAPVSNGAKEIALNKPDLFNGDRDKFKKFLQSVEMYMDVNHKVYRTDLIKIAFVLLFMNSGPATTWKYQFIDEKMKLPPPANPNNKLGQYVNFGKDLVSAFSMFNSVGDALDKLQALRIKTSSSIDEHIARFKLLAAATEIDPNHALTIELFKETLQPELQTWMMSLETPLNKLNDWYNRAIKLDYQYYKSCWAINRTRENAPKKPQPGYYFPWKKRDPNAMDINTLMFNKQTQIMKEGQCFKCKKTGHWVNKYPEGTEDKGKKREEPKKRMNRKEFYTHVQGIFKDLDKKEKDKFLEEAQNVGF